MRKHKLLLGLLVGSLLCLSACSLFNDDDMIVENHYHPATLTDDEPDDPDAVRAQGVAGKEIEAVPNALRFRNIPFGVDGKVTNTYKDGGANHTAYTYNVNGGQDYDSTKNNNNYDLYVPNSASRDGKHLVILFIHGGAWVSGFKTDVNEYVYEFANKGYITATIQYTLLKRSMDDPSLSIFRDLDEIDACITSIKKALEDLHFDTTKTQLAIGGASSGAHLTMLYSYSRGEKSALPIKFLVNAVGPVDIKPENWKQFRNSDVGREAGLTYSAISAQVANLDELGIAGEKAGTVWNDYHTARIANGMCGLPYTLDQMKQATDENEKDVTNPLAPAYFSMVSPNGGEDQLSVTYWMEKGINKFPMVCAYGGKDSIVGIAQYAKLEKAMDDNGITKEYVYFKDANHIDISKDKDPTHYDEYINKISEYCANAIA